MVLTQDLTDGSLKAGDAGTVVHVHQGGAGYEVEFMTLAGETGSRTPNRFVAVRCGLTTNVYQALAASVLVSFGTDWTPSGSRNLLGELKVADIALRDPLSTSSGAFLQSAVVTDFTMERNF